MEHQVLINALQEVLQGKTVSHKKGFLNTDEACEVLGISKSSIYKYRRNNIIPYYKVRGKLWFKKEELEQFISQGRVKSIYELQNEAEKSLNLHRNRR